MKYITPELTTDRLILKRGTFDDYVAVYEYDFRKLRDICGEFEFVRQDPAKLEGYDTYADEEEDVFDWIVYLRDGTPVGNIVADRVDRELNAIELAFNLHPTYWGNEYIKEAVIEICRYLYGIGFASILCGYSEGNRKSKRVNEKIGFKPYKTIENAWVKNGTPITDYQCILSKEDFFKLYPDF